MELKGIPRAIWTTLRKWATRPLTWRNPLTWWKVLPALWAKMPGWAWFVLLAIVLVPLALWGYDYSWTGFGEDVWYKASDLEYRRKKLLWDWLGLLVVPVFLAVAGYAFAHWRATRDREHETDRLREDVLGSYLDRMAELMLEKDLHGSAEDAPVRAVARSRTLLALRRLNGRRKGHLLRFLHESGLITQRKEDLPNHESSSSQRFWDRSIIRLDKADLRKAILTQADLTLADFQNTDLRGAILEWATLNGANLRGARLHEARLRGAVFWTFKDPAWEHGDPPGPRAELAGALLEGADLSRASFIGADLSGADLSCADLRGAVLLGASLCGVNLTGSKLAGAIVREADFTSVDLSGISLKGFDLTRANFFGACLRGTDLSGADLSGAQLHGARDLTQDQINSARGDAATQLPEGLEQPASWRPTAT